MLGPSNDGVNKEVMSSGRCSPVTSSVSPEFGGEAGLAGWIGVSGFSSAIFLFQKCKYKDVIEYLVLLLSDVIK